MAWNDVRRRITRQLDVEIAAVRERMLNTLLISAWDEFVSKLEKGEQMKIQSHVANWVADALSEALADKVDALDVAKMEEA